MYLPGAPVRVSVICLTHDTRHLSQFYQFSFDKSEKKIILTILKYVGQTID